MIIYLIFKFSLKIDIKFKIELKKYMSDYEFEKYLTTSENLKETLKKYGVAIIPSILDEQECNDLVSGIWDFLEHITQTWDLPINRNNKESWKSFYHLFPLHSVFLVSLIIPDGIIAEI